MPAQTTDLFLLEDLENVSRTSALARSDLDALQTVLDGSHVIMISQPQAVIDVIMTAVNAVS